MNNETLPVDYEPCYCGFDHSYEPVEANQAHTEELREEMRKLQEDGKSKDVIIEKIMSDFDLFSENENQTASNAEWVEGIFEGINN